MNTKRIKYLISTASMKHGEKAIYLQGEGSALDYNDCIGISNAHVPRREIIRDDSLKSGYIEFGVV